MVTLTCHSVVWDDDGCPLLAVQIGTEPRFITISLTPETLQALSAQTDTPDTGYARLIGFIQSLLANADMQSPTVEIRAGTDERLHAALIMDGPTGRVSVPIHTIDGLLLAHRSAMPVRLVASDSTQPLGQAPYAESIRTDRVVDSAFRTFDLLASFHDM